MCLGAPCALVLAVVIRLCADPPRDPRRFTIGLETIGVVGAVVVTSALMWRMMLGEITYAASRGVSLGPWLANAVYAVVGVVLSGRWVGCRLARDHLCSWDLTVPTSWFALRWRRIRGTDGGPPRNLSS